jgi:hypothetical protein
MALAGLIVAGGVAGGATLLIASSGGEEEAVQQGQTATPSLDAAATALPSPPATAIPLPSVPAGATLWRWVNVTLVVPDDGRFYVVQDSDPPEARPPKGGPVLKLYRVSTEGPGYLPSSWVHIDAETGAVLRQQLSEENRGEVQAVIGTLALSPLNPLAAPWPYSGEPPTSAVREPFGGMSFIRPAPDTGLVVGGAINDPGGPGLRITNGRSGVGIYIDEATGKLVVNTEYLLPEYKSVFQAWVDTVKLCTAEVSC